MKKHHDFIFAPGIWLGQGKISFTHSPNVLRFYTKWTVNAEEQGIIRCIQEVEMEGREENLFNKLTFRHLSGENFDIFYPHELLGLLEGSGKITANTITWKLEYPPEFEGLETYIKDDKGNYQLHAEYLSGDFKTIINGSLWLKI